MLQSIWNHPSSYLAGLLVCLSLIMAIGPQNLLVLRVSIERRHIAPTLMVTVLADITLIVVGVLGIAALVASLPWLHTALVLGGVVFLGALGWGACQRLLRGGAQVSTDAGKAVEPLSRRQAVSSAVAFTWLSPHAWLDAAVLMGGAAVAQGSGQSAFGAGAATGSLLWFCSLAALGWAIGPRVVRSRRFYRVLDALVVLIMWGTSAQLLWGLLEL